MRNALGGLTAQQAEAAVAALAAVAQLCGHAHLEHADSANDGSHLMFKLPHPFVLLLGGVAVAAALTWILPAGTYERRPDPATGRNLVVPGTYARTEPTPVGPMAALLAVPRGIVAGA